MTSSVSDEQLSEKQIIAKYTSLVEKIARGLARRSTDPVEDLAQVGMIGLVEAYRRFDKDNRASFKTYATHYITGHIRHYLRDKQELFRGPRSLQELSYRLHNVSKELKQVLKREPTNIEIAEKLQVPEEKVEEILVFNRRKKVMWLDQQMGSNSDDENRTLLDTLPSGVGNSEQENLDTSIMLKEAIKKLDPLHQELLRYRYFEDLTQSQIATKLGTSQMDVCRKLKAAVKKLRGELYDFV